MSRTDAPVVDDPVIDAPVVLEARNITKRFPGVLANDKIDLTVRRGEILALLGENGAGKSTLMNILYGLYQPDEGEVVVKGQPQQFSSPRDAIAQGIGMVHQHFQLVPVMTVTENVMLGEEVMRWGGFLDRRRASREVRAFSEKYGLAVNPTAVVGELPVGTQQRVEILKALYRKADILILDEPTAVLTPQESEELFQIMRDLTQQGVSIIFISHKLKEVLAIADRIVVMRAGRVVGSAMPDEATEASLAALMVGREVLLQVSKSPAQPGEDVLQVDDLYARDDRGNEVVRGTSFTIRAGEVLGIAGVQGNGQTELVEVLTGLRSPVSGKVCLKGQDLTRVSPRVMTEAGTAHIPEDRQRYGLVLSYSVAENLILNSYYRPPYRKGLVLNETEIEAAATRRVREFDVRTPSTDVPAANLSGGNQQKLVVARELGRSISLLIAAQPTRGLDVGSIEFIHRRIIEERDAGVAVLLVSAELDEIFGLSDRIAVMSAGRIVKILSIEEATREQVGLLMAGSH